MDNLDWTRIIIIVGWAIVCGLEWRRSTKARMPWRWWHRAAVLVAAGWIGFYVGLAVVHPTGVELDPWAVASRAFHVPTVLLLIGHELITRYEVGQIRAEVREPG